MIAEQGLVYMGTAEVICTHLRSVLRARNVTVSGRVNFCAVITGSYSTSIH